MGVGMGVGVGVGLCRRSGYASSSGKFSDGLDLNGFRVVEDISFITFF